MTDEENEDHGNGPVKYCAIDIGNGQFLYCPEKDILEIKNSEAAQKLRQRAREFIANSKNKNNKEQFSTKLTARALCGDQLWSCLTNEGEEWVLYRVANRLNTRNIRNPPRDMQYRLEVAGDFSLTFSMPPKTNNVSGGIFTRFSQAQKLFCGLFKRLRFR